MFFFLYHIMDAPCLASFCRSSWHIGSCSDLKNLNKKCEQTFWAMLFCTWFWNNGLAQNVIQSKKWITLFALQTVSCRTTLRRESRWTCLLTLFMSTTLSMMELSSTGVCVCVCVFYYYLLPPSFFTLHHTASSLLSSSVSAFSPHLVVARSPWWKQRDRRRRVGHGGLLLGNTSWEWLSQPRSWSLNRNEPICLLLTVVFGLWRAE